MKNFAVLNVILCTALLALSACGIKPPYVEPPAGAKHDTFPHTYPDPSTDPQPGLERKHY